MTTSIESGAAICKVVAPSSRQALRLLREKLGPDAIVVSTRVTPEGMEVVATLEEVAPALPPPVAFGAEPQAATLASSSPAFEAPPVSSAEAGGDSSVLREIHSMRGMIEEQLAGLAWNEAQKRDPLRGQLLRTLLGAGFSARLSKDFLADLPTGQSHASGLDYLKLAMARQMPMLEDEEALMRQGGVYALMGPTGVGKTTTTAKLAARCVMRFGSDKLALVTTDSYRIGAYEQLRIYGQILGVAVYAVKDAVDLERVLVDLRDKHMVLIDTVGMSQRDRAVAEQISMLCGASRPVNRLLLLNASSHGDTLNEVVQAYRHDDRAGKGSELAGCILTKVDEATHPGALIDTVIRHQLPVYYVSSGQKVPEHLMLGNRTALIDSVFQARSPSALFVPGEADLEELPAVLRHEAQAAEAVASSERLRSQCQQLIRALAHNAQELTGNAAALSSGQICFDETRALWRQLPDEQVDEHAIAQAMLSQALATSSINACDYILATSSDINFASAKNTVFRARVTALLSDRSGLPFAATHEFMAGAAKAGGQPSGLPSLPDFKQPVVHLLARLSGVEPVQQWQSGGLHWVASAPASLGVVAAESGLPTTLAKLGAGLSFSASQSVVFRGKTAWLSTAEVAVSLRPEAQGSGVCAAAGAPVLRCVVRRIVDAASGKPLMHGYVLASAGIETSALSIVQWVAWRTAAEPYFKLLNQGISQLEDSHAGGAAALRKAVLVAAQASITVFCLQQTRQAWAETARNVLAQLTGRSVRADRPAPGSALFEGLGKLCVLLDALQVDESAELPAGELAVARK